MIEGLSWRRVVLPNGLRVLLFPQMSDLTMQVAVAVEYGSNEDSLNTSGTAHFLEHMLAGGSAKRIGLSRSIEHHGGSSTFLTTNEYTIGVANVVPERAAEASHILSELVFDSTFEEEKFDLEHKIILNEIYETLDDPNEKVNDLLRRCLFRTHPVRQPVFGYLKTVNQLRLDRIVERHQTYYVPRNMILVLTGRFFDKDVETVLQDFTEST